MGSSCDQFPNQLSLFHVAMALTSCILIFSHDPTLLDTRRWVLERDGFEITTLSTISSVMAALTSKSTDLIILCHTLTAGERRAAIATARGLEPPVRTLCIATSCQGFDEDGVSGDVLDSITGAQALIAAARKALA